MPTVVERYTDYLDVVDETINKYSSKQTAKKKILEKYKDTPIEDVPEEALLVLYSDSPIDSIPDQVRSRIMNFAVAAEAKRRGPLREEEKTQYNVEAAGRGGMPSIPITRTSKAAQIGFKEGALDSLKVINAVPENTLREEFSNRAEVMREGAMPDYFGGLAAGSTLDPVTGVTTAGVGAGVGLLTKGKPLLNALLTGGGAGAVAGALIPTYEEFGDSRLRNMAIGGGIGVGTVAAPVSVIKGAELLRGKPAAVVEPPVLAPQPVPRTLWNNRVKPTETKVTNVTIDLEPQVTQSTPSTLKIQNIDRQIIELKEKAATVGRTRRRPIEAQIKRLEEARTAELNRANKKAKEVNDQVIVLENQINRLAKRAKELQPGQAGAQARIERANRRIQELETDIDVLTGFDFAPNGGYRVTVNGELYDNPRRIVALKNRIDFNNSSGSKVEVILPPPKPTGDPVTDAANKINYIQLSGDAGPRLGLDAPPTLSSAGVRPSVQYGPEISRGVDEEQLIKAGTMAPSTASRKAKGDMGVDVGRTEQMTAEEKGRRVEATSATEERQKIIKAEQMGLDEEDALWTIENIPTISDKFTFENLEASARILKQEGYIARNYDTLLDMLMDTKRILTAEEMEALRPLFLEAENRIDSIFKRMQKLQREGLVDSEEMVELVQDLYLNTYVADLRRANGTAASHILTQAKKSKAFTAANTRRVDTKKLITNLFGVDCG